MQPPIRYLKGVGPKKEQVFKTMGIYTREDLLYYLPFRYEDRTNFKTIKDLAGGERAVVQGTVLVKNFRYLPGRKTIFDIVLKDDTGKVKVRWFNQPYLKDSIQCGDLLLLYGRVEEYHRRLQFICPVFEKLTDASADKASVKMGRIVPVYGLAGNLTQDFLRRLMHAQLGRRPPELLEPLPENLRTTLNFPEVYPGLCSMHFPASFLESERARERFIFEELFVSQMLVYLRKARRKRSKGIAHFFCREFMQQLFANLPFQLTPSQDKVLAEIMQDMRASSPMHRLLQGDVGSGKTVIAALSIGMCVSSGSQAALMVPTEVLALQHVSVLKDLFRGLPVTIEVILGSTPGKDKQRIRQRLIDGTLDIVVGTHALIQDEVFFKRLGLVVIDEQHRFGTAQRSLLPKKGENPDVLVMSATPIPRSLALTLYGDLDISIIEKPPAGRKAPQSFIITEEKRPWLYQFIKARMREGRQVYVVYPVIEDPDRAEVKAVETMYGHWKRIFKEYRVGMLHGRLSANEKYETLLEFRTGRLAMLVSTSLIEVGIDVPNATCMVVENPESFGLSQLHQLRGRICRASLLPHFIMVRGSTASGDTLKRLKVIAETTDGFKISEEDLKMRGPGDFFGKFQHGFPENRISNPLRDIEILKKARWYAYQVVKGDPALKLPEHQELREYLKRRLLSRVESRE